jgi:hypothetical protein
MEPTDLRDGHHAPELGRMHLARLGTVVVERLVWSRGVVVGTVGAQESAEMGLAQDEDMTQKIRSQRDRRGRPTDRWRTRS